MKLVIDSAIPFMENRFPKDVEIVFLGGKDIGKEDVRDADGLIVRTRTLCNSELLEGSKVKAIATATIGTDHIDLNWCERNGIRVFNAPGCNAPGVAQYVFASLFHAGFDPERHTLGIVGFGNVGSVVGDWARQMGINILISDLPKQQQGYEDADYVSLEELLKNSDAVTLHVPLTNQGLFPTYHLIGAGEIKMMKEGAILINSSRGGVVDENAWKKAIKESHVKGIIDVWENEPEIDTELADRASIATPHIAGYSEQGKKRATAMALEAMGQILGFPVNLSELECKPDNKRKITRELIEKSYNPIIDTKNLRVSKPEEIALTFEMLRNSYNYRTEPLFEKQT